MQEETYFATEIGCVSDSLGLFLLSTCTFFPFDRPLCSDTNGILTAFFSLPRFTRRELNSFGQKRCCCLLLCCASRGQKYAHPSYTREHARTNTHGSCMKDTWRRRGLDWITLPESRILRVWRQRDIFFLLITADVLNDITYTNVLSGVACTSNLPSFWWEHGVCGAGRAQRKINPLSEYTSVPKMILR